MKIQSLRGMHDLLPENSAIWQYLEKTVAGSEHLLQRGLCKYK